MGPGTEPVNLQEILGLFLNLLQETKDTITFQSMWLKSVKASSLDLFSLMGLHVSVSSSHIGSSSVLSSNTAPIANLGQDTLLSCYLFTKVVTRVSVTWDKKDLIGVVYKYKNGAANLQEQNSQFKGRTDLFTDALPTGNASLLLRSVRSSDAGEYTCMLSSSKSGGTVNIHLRTAGRTTRLSSLSECLLWKLKHCWHFTTTIKHLKVIRQYGMWAISGPQHLCYVRGQTTNCIWMDLWFQPSQPPHSQSPTVCWRLVPPGGSLNLRWRGWTWMRKSCRETPP